MKKYTMNDKQLARLLDAGRPVPYLVIGGRPPMSPQVRANSAWASLGKEMGFDSMTVRPVPSEGDKVFLAEPVEDTK